MNYISHFRLDRHREDYIAFGTLFPDLARGPLPHLRLFGIVPGLAHSGPVEESMKHGMLRHFEVDKKFHSSSFMLNYSSLLKERFMSSEAGKSGARMFFVSHILTEMLLDRVLLVHEPALGTEFYDLLARIDTEVITGLFRSHPEYQPERFTEFFHRFRDSRYLFSYLETEGLFYALNRICKNIGTPGFAAEHFSAFKEITTQAEKMMAGEYLKLFEELSSPG